MRVNRAWMDAPLAVGQQVTLPDSVVIHLLKVLRLRSGDPCVLFNGDGHDYCAELVHADRRGGTAHVLGRTAVDNESPLRIVLVQGIARGEKMDWILQKATELGVAAIVPVSSDRSEVKLDAQRAEKRLSHWRNVVTAACEQSGRAVVPPVHVPADLSAACLELPHAALRLTLDPTAGSGVRSLTLSAPATVIVAIGPEGGWSPRDRGHLAAAGFAGLRLGPRILRTETAGLAAIAALQARYGDLV